MARIVFDLDGTLIDSAPDIHAIANGVLAEEGREPVTLDEARSFIGNGVAVFVQKMRAARGLPDSEQARLQADFVERYEYAVDLTQPYPGVRAVLEALTAEGHRLGICTNKPLRPTHAVLSHLRLDEMFETVFGGDSLPVHKPDPAPLLAAFAALGEGPVIYVGDSEVDAETARRAGSAFALYSEGYRKGPVTGIPFDAVFSDFAELGGIVARLLAEGRARAPL